MRVDRSLPTRMPCVARNDWIVLGVDFGEQARPTGTSMQFRDPFDRVGEGRRTRGVRCVALGQERAVIGRAHSVLADLFARGRRRRQMAGPPEGEQHADGDAQADEGQRWWS